MRADVAIVGAGPAGMAAAQLLVDAGLTVTVIDEQGRPGGQIYRQPPQEFTVPNWLASGIYAAGKRLLSEVSVHPQVDWHLRTTVLGIECNGDTRTLVLDAPGGLRLIDAAHVLIAPGCYDMPVPFPGSTLPGVMATGAIQAFIKSQQIVAGDTIVLSGTHPLQLIVADQIVQAGGRVAAVLFAQSLRSVLAAALSMPLAILGSGQLAFFTQVLWRLRKAKVPIRFSQTVVQANGGEALESIDVGHVGSDGRIDRSRSYRIACDRLGVCYGFLSSSELTRQVGARHAWSRDGGGWICRCDEWMRTNVPGISVAGEITGVAGAQVAAEEGRLAALGILQTFARITEEEARRRASPVRKRLARLNRFAQGLRSASAVPWRLLEDLQSADAIVCKCEEVTCGELTALLDANPTVRTANTTKLLSRVGMGLCQGRYCGHYLTCLLNARTGGETADAIGAFSAQFPAKPVRISALTKALSSDTP